MKRLWWKFYFFFLCRPYSLKQFRIFCTKLDGMSPSDWEDMEKDIMTSEALKKYFRIK